MLFLGLPNCPTRRLPYAPKPAQNTFLGPRGAQRAPLEAPKGPKTRFFGFPTPKIGAGVSKDSGPIGGRGAEVRAVKCSYAIYIYIYIYIYAICIYIYIYIWHRFTYIHRPPRPYLLYPHCLWTPAPPIFGVGNPKKRVLGPFGASRGALRAPQGAKNVF